MKIALVYDYVTTRYGGAEVVLEELHRCYPDAPLFTTVADTSRATWAAGWQIVTSFLQRLPRPFARRHQWQALFSPIATETLDVSDFDVIISVSAGTAKGVITRPDQFHLCYVLAPTRYLYETNEFKSRWLVSLLLKLPLRYLRWWDTVASARPDAMIAISQLVAEQVKTHYHRTVEACIYPPFRPRILPSPTTNKQLEAQAPFDLVISRLVWYKKVEIAIAGALANQTTLYIVGSGSYVKTLKQRAGIVGIVRRSNESINNFTIRATQQHAKILFFGSLPDPETTTLLSEARSLLMIGQEDFGMTALEALSLGKPVIINASSGVAELLKDKTHGLLLPEVTVQSVTRALRQLDTLQFRPTLLKQTALRYSDTVFRQQFMSTVQTLWQQYKERYDNNA